MPRLPVTLRPSSFRCVLRLSYLLIVGCLALAATANPNEPTGVAFIAAIILTMPMFIPALPLFYAISAAAWSATGADSGGPTWPVTVTYVAAFVAIGTANAALIRHLACSGDRPCTPNGRFGSG